MDRKVDFVCCDDPTASKFTVHILAAVAEHERDAISARTKHARRRQGQGQEARQPSPHRRGQAAGDRRTRRGRTAIASASDPSQGGLKSSTWKSQRFGRATGTAFCRDSFLT
jgi:DNA invertase Pin-like site-specific DNA recombinase